MAFQYGHFSQQKHPLYSCGGLPKQKYSSPSTKPAPSNSQKIGSPLYVWDTNGRTHLLTQFYKLVSLGISLSSLSCSLYTKYGPIHRVEMPSAYWVIHGFLVWTFSPAKTSFKELLWITSNRNILPSTKPTLPNSHESGSPLYVWDTNLVEPIYFLYFTCWFLWGFLYAFFLFYSLCFVLFTLSMARFIEQRCLQPTK